MKYLKYSRLDEGYQETLNLMQNNEVFKDILNYNFKVVRTNIDNYDEYEPAFKLINTNFYPDEIVFSIYFNMYTCTVYSHNITSLYAQNKKLVGNTNIIFLFSSKFAYKIKQDNTRLTNDVFSELLNNFLYNYLYLTTIKVNENILNSVDKTKVDFKVYGDDSPSYKDILNYWKHLFSNMLKDTELFNIAIQLRLSYFPDILISKELNNIKKLL